MGKSPQTVVGVSRQVTVKYQDTDGNSLHDDIILKGVQGTYYESEQKAFENYDFLELLGGEATGVFTKDPIVLTYVYKRQEGKVIVNYEDEDGNTIANQVVLTGDIGSAYSAERKSIPGYRYLRVKEGSALVNGEIGREEQIVTFVYGKIEYQQGKVTVNYEDEDGNVIASREIFIGDIGTDYSAIQKSIPGYVFSRMKEGSAPVNGEIHFEEQAVTFIYKKTDDTAKKEDQRENLLILVEPDPLIPWWWRLDSAGSNLYLLNTKDHFNYVIGYKDGTFQPNANLTRAEAATIFFRLLTKEARELYITDRNEFSDVSEGQWFNTAISTLSSIGIVNGYNDGTFRPNALITRAELAAIIARFAELNSSAKFSFTDIDGHWAERSILLAARSGWITGYEDRSFRPDLAITRAETVAMINRLLDRVPKHKESLLRDMLTFYDNLDTEKWYYIPIQEATNFHQYVKSKTDETWVELIENIDWTIYEH
ncbi:MAG: hypothetical protein GX633_04375 [Clostridiales bacterium]|nr:hypothetical protein [Clostridiales bacterium]